MKQQINLYQEQFRPRRVTLPARQVVLIEAALVAVLIVVSAAVQWSVYSAGSAQDRLAGEKRALEQSVAELKTAAEKQSIDKALQARVAETNRQLQARRKVLEWVTESQARNNITFSTLLAGPGRRHVEGLWLERIRIDGAGSALQLKGNVLEAELIPEFLTALQKEPAYAGREFRKLIVEENEDSAGMRFLLTTTPPSEDAVTLNEWKRPPSRNGRR